MKLDSFEQKFTEVLFQLLIIKDNNNLLHNNLNSITKWTESLEIEISSRNKDFLRLHWPPNRSKNIIMFNFLEASNNFNNSDASILFLINLLWASNRFQYSGSLSKLNGKIWPLKISLKQP